MKRIDLAICGAFLLRPTVHSDHRGFFFESYHQERMQALGLRQPFVQDNHSRSLRGVLRGLHYQIRQPQGKLVRVVAGEVFDVAVDLRPTSPTFGKWLSATLSAADMNQFYVPTGFAHGFLTLEPNVEVAYKVSNYYSKDHDCSLNWADRSLAIHWPLPAGAKPILSEKDVEAPGLSAIKREIEAFR